MESETIQVPETPIVKDDLLNFVDEAIAERDRAVEKQIQPAIEEEEVRVL